MNTNTTVTTTATATETTKVTAEDEISVVSSDFSKRFTAEDEFVDFAKEREKNSEWSVVEAKTVQFEPLYNEPIMAPAVAAKYAADQTAIEECMLPLHSGLVCKVGPLFHPVGDSAIGTIRERMQVRKGFWTRQHENPGVLAKDLNSSFAMMKGDVLVKVGDEMVRAVHSSRYAQITLSDVHQLAREFLSEQFPNAKFMSGSFSHDFGSMLFDLSSYKGKLLSQSKTVSSNSSVHPALFVQTSDVSLSSVTIRPVLLYGSTMAPLAVREDTRHLGREETVTEHVANSFNVAMAKFVKAVGDVEKLNTIQLNNAQYAILRAFVAIKWPKAAKPYALQAADNFWQMFSESGIQATAYDAYMSILDALSYYVHDFPNANNERIMDSVARAVKIDWTACDLPGTFSY